MLTHARPGTAIGTDRVEGLHRAVAATARRSPGALALVDRDRSLSYGELDRRARAWAAELTALGVRSGHLVPIVLPRNAELVTALLAVLHTGAAYCLLDPSWPPARLAALVGQLGSPVVCGPATLAEQITEERTLWTPSERPAPPPPDLTEADTTSDDAGCVFFTSGTTGSPKGSITPHGAIARLFRAGPLTRLADRTVVPVGAPTPWDAFALELWWPLLNGGTALFDDEPYLTGPSLRRAVTEHRATATWLTSSVFNMIVDEDPRAFAGLAMVVTGGERLSPRHVRLFLEHHPDIDLFNGYGPVESTVFATMHRITLEDCDLAGGIPLGTEVPGTTVYVLRGDDPCPTGAQGEIVIAGEGLAREYLGDEALTRTAFVRLTLDGTPVRVYRTGDLGVRDHNGLLHFRGRADRRLKIRGHRIEPSEVERQIEGLLPVRACHVLAAPGDDGRPGRLLAFCVPHDPQDRLSEALSVLRRELPAYQTPDQVVTVRALPLTPNGKTDAAALLDLVRDSGRHAPHAKPPAHHGALLALVRDLFSTVLGRPCADSSLSFFDQGGSSLDAGRLCTRLSQATGRPVPVSGLYQHPTPEALAVWLAREEHQDHIPSRAPGTAPLTPIQTLFLTRHLADPSDRTGHCLLTWVIEGQVDLDALESAVAFVHHRHEVLRAAYVTEPFPHPQLVDLAPPPVEELPAEPRVDGAVAAVRRAFDEDLDPTAADLWRLALVPVGDDTSVLGVVVHHIAFDGWSEHLLAAELTEAYNAATAGKPPALPAAPVPLDLSWRHCANATPEDRTRTAEALAGAPDIVWPGAACDQNSAEDRFITAAFPQPQMHRLERQSRKAATTPFVTLLTAFAAAVAEVTGNEDFVVSTPVNQRADPQTAQAIGCHINTLFLRLRSSALKGDLSALRAVTETLRRARAAGDIPYTTAVELAGPRRSGRPPVAQIMFALQNNPSPLLGLRHTRSSFIRQPYLDIPLELHAELWPEPQGGLRLDVSHRPDTGGSGSPPAQAITDAFLRITHTLLDRM
ncbi:AMP-binding protein [Streptomyces mesophilus]|uniref:AMP-binding protein n=1 Tax=Streptomyces mesophilus TaxID=1775132 RepID=UPI003322EA22